MDKFLTKKQTNKIKTMIVPLTRVAVKQLKFREKKDEQPYDDMMKNTCVLDLYVSQ